MFIDAELIVGAGPGDGTEIMLRFRRAALMVTPLRPASCSPTTTRSCAAACGRCSTASRTSRWSPRRRTEARPSAGARPRGRPGDPRRVDAQADRAPGDRRACAGAGSCACSSCRSTTTSSTSSRRCVQVPPATSSRAPPTATSIDACRAAMRGEPFLYPKAVTALIRDYLERAGGDEAAPRDPLTARELQVVKLIAEGTPATRSPPSSSSAARPSITTARTSSTSSACATSPS